MSTFEVVPQANRFQGYCRLCGGVVPKGSGHLISLDPLAGMAKWAVEHQPGKCPAAPPIDPLAEATDLHAEVETRTVTHGVSLDAGGGMVALRCRSCGHIDEAHDCDGTVMQHQEWFLFLWRDVFRDYTGGVAFAIARNRTEAIAIVSKEISGTQWVKEIETKIPDRLSLNEPFGFTLDGGA